MPMRGVRGAITVSSDETGIILEATRELLAAILDANPSLDLADLASVIFTLTDDLCTAYPAMAARQMGWGAVPLLCAQEIPVPGGLPHVIRVLLHWNTDLPQSQVQHVYLREAVSLRPDLSN